MIERLRTADRALLGIVALALVLRIAVAFWPPIHHADELWQYLEPARHVLGEQWVRTWEAGLGMRSWLVPVGLAGPMGLGQAIAPQSGLDIILPRLVCVGIAMIGIAGAAGLGWRVSRTHGLVAAFVGAIWYEWIYFGPRTLSEPIATALFLGAAWLLSGETRPRRFVIAGLMLGLCCLVRFQYAPSVAVLAIGMARTDLARWKPMLLGGVAAAAISALAELAMGATPFLWMFRNLQSNLIENRSAMFGVSPAWWYLQALWELWGPALFLILGLAGLAARRYPVLFAAAIVNIALHSMIPHKEYRFILLSTSILVVLAAIGSVDLLQRRFAARRAVVALGAGWFLLSGLCGALGASASQWGNSGRLIAAWRIAGQQPGICGVALYRSRHVLAASHTLFRRDLPIYQYDDGDAPAALQSRAFNVVVAPGEREADLTGYRLAGCGSNRTRDYCVYRREGGCTPSPADAQHDIDRFLRRHDGRK
ncbi:mannosyltransferase [Sphingomonas sp. AOB5]|uniref:mannosyltransferase n=1 Tax=Sphingomonas sp. AOB5 TaxID=3034017 RepID=UPI0023F67D0E|nr:mannosyltransferase [Sphingomonas sp. AOB5]MDF7776486.1 mannosyltransferase [Sphingomonas sp. AOB5]